VRASGRAKQVVRVHNLIRAFGLERKRA